MLKRNYIFSQKSELLDNNKFKDFSKLQWHENKTHTQEDTKVYFSNQEKNETIQMAVQVIYNI